MHYSIYGNFKFGSLTNVSGSLLGYKTLYLMLDIVITGRVFYLHYIIMSSSSLFYKEESKAIVYTFSSSYLLVQILKFCSSIYIYSFRPITL